jgi:hypothetical protein
MNEKVKQRTLSAKGEQIRDLKIKSKLRKVVPLQNKIYFKLGEK